MDSTDNNLKKEIPSQKPKTIFNIIADRQVPSSNGRHYQNHFIFIQILEDGEIFFYLKENSWFVLCKMDLKSYSQVVHFYLKQTF